MNNGSDHPVDAVPRNGSPEDHERGEVLVPTPSGEVIAVDPRKRRADVVRRLFGLGVSRSTLIALLPDWIDLIDEAATVEG